MLTGKEIIELQKRGDIVISDFDINRVNPNSYNLRMDRKLLVYKLKKPTLLNKVIFGYLRFLNKYVARCMSDSALMHEIGLCVDSKRYPNTKEIIIPKSGYILQPGEFYLASTVESTYAKNLIPCIDGRSSTARLGIEIHRTAGFGDVGFNGKWTLEITAAVPVRIYPNQEICQIYFEKPDGDSSMIYEGKYQNQYDVTASKMYRD